MLLFIAAADATVTLPAWALWIVGVGSVCTGLVAMAGAWLKVGRPLMRFGATLDSALPAMLAIGQRYADEHGGEALTAELSGMASNQASIAENQQLLVAKLDTHGAKLDAQNVKLDELHDYSHRMRHDIIGDVGKLGMALGTTTTIVDALVVTADELRRVREALERNNPPEPPTG